MLDNFKEQTRRKFIETSAAIAAGFWASSGYAKKVILSLPSSSIAENKHSFFLHISQDSLVDPAQLPLGHSFPLGIASGDLTPEGTILWTKYTGQKSLWLVVWKEVEPSSWEQIALEPVEISEAGFVHYDFPNLEVSQRYQFCFVEEEQGYFLSRSALGCFLSAPDPNSYPNVTLAGTCCTFNAFSPQVLEHAGSRKDIHAFLLLGDTSYNDGCSTLNEFRARWFSNLSKPGYLSLRASTSLIATLDDHEIYDDFDMEKVDGHKFQAGMAAFFEHLPIRRNPLFSQRIWRQFRWGKTVEIFVLDCRTERKASVQQYLSIEQMTWLKEGLKSSEAMFKVIMNSVPITTFPFKDKEDRWEGYPAQREEILSFIDKESIPGVLWVSGDAHFGALTNVSKTGFGSQAKEILVGPGAQVSNMAGSFLKKYKQYEWVTLQNNYMGFTFRPESEDIELKVHASFQPPESSHKTEVKLAYERKFHLNSKGALI